MGADGKADAAYARRAYQAVKRDGGIQAEFGKTPAKLLRYLAAERFQALGRDAASYRKLLLAFDDEISYRRGLAKELDGCLAERILAECEERRRAAAEQIARSLEQNACMAAGQVEQDAAVILRCAVRERNRSALDETARIGEAARNVCAALSAVDFPGLARGPEEARAVFDALDALLGRASRL